MLSVKNLSFMISEPAGQRAILNGLSFEVRDGELLVITGPNGGGKSTLARVLMGLVPASGGSIALDGRDISGLSVDERARAGLGFAFQQPPRFKGLTVKKLISLAAGRDMSKDECCAVLSRVGLCAREYVEREADATLSGGEMKRIEIATVLAGRHRLCIFDEPEAGIDLWSFSMLIKEFERIHKEGGAGLIIISHQERIISMADRIMVLSGGEIVKLDRREEIMPQLERGEEMCGCLVRGEGGVAR